MRPGADEARPAWPGVAGSSEPASARMTMSMQCIDHGLMFVAQAFFSIVGTA